MKKILVLIAIAGFSILSLAANAFTVKNEASGIAKIANVSNQPITVVYAQCPMANMHDQCKHLQPQMVTLAPLGKPGSTVKVTIHFPGNENAYGILDVLKAKASNAYSTYTSCSTSVELYSSLETSTIALQDLGDGSIYCSSGVSRHK